ncbi:MAG: dTDP-4-dehydrorhamnose reductase [Planctomycetota bacterium]|nr:dTDP-4-dehydrorhamnose reductase [Planctomycetota bacterium]
MPVDYLVTGALGQLGRAVMADVAARGQTACATDIPDLCVEDIDSVRRWIGDQEPRTVLHCGAWTDVDGCEQQPDRADLINGAGTANVAKACAEAGIGLVYISTDFVFDGSGERPYLETDAPDPISAYGRSKLLGEQAVLEQGRGDFYVMRTSWVFGPGGKNFPAAILARARSGQPLRVVTDQVGRPTMTHDLAAAMLDLCTSGAEAGLYHASNEGVCSWHEFAVDVVAAAGLDIEVGTMHSSELDRPAPRPAYSVLDTSRLSAARGAPMPHYRDALRRYIEEETK